MTRTDRLIIEKLYNKGDSFRSIAETIGFCVSSVYREIQHGLSPHLGAETTRRPYHDSAKIAQDCANLQAIAKSPNIKLAITVPALGVKDIRVAVAGAFHIDDLYRQTLFVQRIGHQAQQLPIVRPVQGHLVGQFRNSL